MSSGRKVSIGIPVRNGARYLAETLDSLLGQTHSDLQVILGDNGSDDETEQICRGYAARDGRLVYARSEVDRGAAWNYNRVAERAEGVYFKWAAHDDVLAPSYIERCVAALEQDQNAVLAFTDTIVIDDVGRERHPLKYPLDASDPRTAKRYAAFQQFFAVMRPFQCNAVFGLIRNDALRRTRKLGTHWGSDAVLLAELVLQGTFLRLPETLFYRRDHAERSMRQNKRLEDIAAWFDPQLPRNPYFPQWQCWLEHWRTLSRAEIGFGERLRCRWAMLRATNARPLVREVRRGVRRRLGRGGRQPDVGSDGSPADLRPDP